MALLIPRAKTLLSYVGRLTSARTSPVCGFMTITTPRLMPTSFIAHFIAFWAYCCSFVSIVSVSESPGRASVSGLEGLRLAARSVALDALGPVDAPQLVSYCASRPTLPIRSSGR